MFGLPGWAELTIVAAIVLILFGGRFTKVCRSLGETIGVIRKIGDDNET